MLDGEKLLQQGRSEEAVRRLRDAVEFLPGNAQAWNHLGLALHATKRPGEAAAAYEHALRLDRNLAAAYFNLGCLRLELGNPAAATESMRSYVLLQPKAAEGWLRLGQAQLRLRQYELAEHSFRSALRLQGRDPEALNGLGVTFQQRRRPREAWQCFTNAIALSPRHAPAWLNLAVVAHQAGARPHAVRAYREYAALRPDSARALGLDELIRQLSPPPAPVWAVAATNRAAAPPPSSRVAVPAVRTNDPGITPGAVVAMIPSRPLSPTNRIASTNVAITGPARPLPPPAETNESRIALATPARAPTETVAPSEPAANAETNAAPALTTTTSAPSDGWTPVPDPASTRPPSPVSDSTVRSNPVLTSVSASAVNTATSAVPSEPQTALSPSPGISTSTPPVATTVETEAPAPVPPEMPVEVIQLQPEPGLAVEVKDEASAVSTPEATVRSATTNASEPPPLIRPIGARKPVASSDKRGFWGHANPLNWFGSDEEPTSPSTASDTGRREAADGSATADADADASHWRWTRPGSWFRSGRGEVAEPTERKGETVAHGTPTNRLAFVEPTPGVGVGVVRTSPPPAKVVAAASAAPAVDNAPPRELQRYVYRSPRPQPAGDTAAARRLVVEGIEEHRRSRLDVAVSLYEQALKLDPASFDAHQYLASARLQRGDLDQALAASEAALALRPDSAPTRLNFALALDRAGYSLDAALEAERILVNQPNDVSTQLLLGNLYSQKLDRPERAREHYLRVIELDPENSQSVAIRRWLAGRR